MADQPAFLVVAKIVAPFGIKGEVKAEIWTQFPDRLANRTVVFLGREDETPRMVALRGVRFHQGQALLTLEGCPDRTAAEALRGLLVQIPSTEAPAPPPGAFYLYQIIGLRVVDPEGQEWGTITDVLSTPSNDIYVATGAHGRLLIPAVPDFVLAVDLEHSRIIANVAGLH
jgi:16S rRNA processing protein RimM